jgi:hypothetical protein
VHDRARDRLPELLLAGGILASAVLLLVLQSRLTFLLDDWDFLIQRRGFDAHVVFDPHNEHISVLPVLIYKGIQAGIGMESLLPYAVVSTGLFLISVVLLFVILRRAVGSWLALAGVVPLLVFGSASEDLLTPFQMGYFGSVAAGLGALLALDWEDRRGDPLACVLLVVSLCFSSVGLPFLAGVAVWILIHPDRRRRIYVVAVPAVLYGLWWIGWGHTAKTSVTFNNLATSPSYVLDGFASSLSSLLGLATPRDEQAITALDWGRPLLVGAVALAVFALRRTGRISDRLLVALAIGLSFWFLASLNSSSVRAPTVSRYQFVGAVIILLIAAELARGTRLPTRGVAIALAVAAVSALSNAEFLHNQYSVQRAASVQVRGDLAGLELAADRVSPTFVLTPENSGFQYFGQVVAGPFLSAADSYGSPGYSIADLPSAPDSAKTAADRVAAAAEGIALHPSRAARSPGCRSVSLASTGKQVATLGPGHSILRNSGGTPVRAFLARYSTLVSVDLGEIGAGRTVALAIPRDRSDVPWRLALMGPGRVTLCGAAAGT